jgi:putative transposase
MSNRVITRTLKASIRNHSQVCDDLDSHGFAASKVWNVGRWTISRVWDAISHIPDADELCSYLKTHDRYADLHSQSSQRVLQNSVRRSFRGTNRTTRMRTHPATANTATTTHGQR